MARMKCVTEGAFSFRAINSPLHREVYPTAALRAGRGAIPLPPTLLGEE